MRNKIISVNNAVLTSAANILQPAASDKSIKKLSGKVQKWTSVGAGIGAVFFGPIGAIGGALIGGAMAKDTDNPKPNKPVKPKKVAGAAAIGSGITAGSAAICILSWAGIMSVLTGPFSMGLSLPVIWTGAGIGLGICALYVGLSAFAGWLGGLIHKK
ncbi:MAG: hypothetical protein WC860_07780 [Candidatus Margulisiibacteriota bacterium]|jgi:hypothetical protein